MKKINIYETRVCERCEDTNYLISDFQNSQYLPLVILACFGISIFLFYFHAMHGPLPKLLWFPCIGCGGLALILFFCIYLPKGIIGNYIYYFKDKDNILHCHKKIPTWVKTVNKYYWETPPKNVAQWNAKDFQVSGPIIQVNFGGWFKKSAVYPNPQPKGNRLNEGFRVLPNRKQSFNLHTDKPDKSVIYQIDIETIIKLVEHFNCMNNILYAAINNEENKKPQPANPHLN